MVWISLPEGWLPLPAYWTPSLFTGGAVFGHIFVLAVMGDVLAVQADRLFGRPTLPTVFGEKTTRGLLRVFLAVWTGGLILGAILGALPSLAWMLIISGPLYNFFLLGRLFPEKGRDDLAPSLSGYRFEALMYGQLPLTGLFCLAWRWL